MDLTNPQSGPFRGTTAFPLLGFVVEVKNHDSVGSRA